MDSLQFYRQLKIKTKLLVLVLGVVLISVLTLSALSIRDLNRSSDALLNAAESQLRDAVVRRMQLTGQAAADQVLNLINTSFAVPLSWAQTLGDSAQPATPLERMQVRDLTRSMLAANPQLSSLYAQFEPNTYDKQDANNQGNLEHSSNSGTLEVYWVREGGELVFYPSEDPEEKYASERDENGLREAEWYLCSMESAKPCVMDPYLYEIEPGKEELMTTLAAPILQKGKFIGLVGADINLPIIQRWLTEQSQSFFNGKSQLTLISQHKLLVASTEFPDGLGKRVDQVATKLTPLLSQTNSTSTEGDTWHAVMPLDIAPTGVTWKLVVSVPRELALAAIAQMREENQKINTSSQRFIMLVTLVLLAIAVVLAILLANSLSTPIRQVSDSVNNLASNEGDLTQTIVVNSHRELIYLAEGLNQFIAKLRDMITALKDVSRELGEDVRSLDQRARHMRAETDKQESNLTNVVAAITQMSATASEVAQLATGTATHSQDSARLLNVASDTFRQNMQEVDSLSAQMEKTSDQISQVASRSNDITGIIVTIQGIAEQTNLLALNAAIEAARAGEQGRGFAVVADEVRNLAARTQSSTGEIGSLIESLHNDVDTAVKTLSTIQQSVSGTVDKTRSSFTHLTEVQSSIAQISDYALQVATAAEQQSTVSEEINQRVVAIGDGSKHLSELGDDLENLSQRISRVVELMNGQLGRLKS